jgi:hypothetical protein
VKNVPNPHKTLARQRLCSALRIKTKYLSISIKNTLKIEKIEDIFCSKITKLQNYKITKLRNRDELFELVNNSIFPISAFYL